MHGRLLTSEAAWIYGPCTTLNSELFLLHFMIREFGHLCYRPAVPCPRSEYRFAAARYTFCLSINAIEPRSIFRGYSMVTSFVLYSYSYNAVSRIFCFYFFFFLSSILCTVCTVSEDGILEAPS